MHSSRTAWTEVSEFLGSLWLKITSLISVSLNHKQAGGQLFQGPQRLGPWTNGGLSPVCAIKEERAQWRIGFDEKYTCTDICFESLERQQVLNGTFTNAH